MHSTAEFVAKLLEVRTLLLFPLIQLELGLRGWDVTSPYWLANRSQPFLVNTVTVLLLMLLPAKAYAATVSATRLDTENITAITFLRIFDRTGELLDE
jgi:hypothetical protein